MNKAWLNLLYQQGAGYSQDELESVDTSRIPYSLGTLNDLYPSELRKPLAQSCVYVLQPESPGFEKAEGVIAYSAAQIDIDAVERTFDSLGWTSSKGTDSDEDEDQEWKSSTCGRATEFTRLAQNKPAIVGGSVEGFSQELTQALPNATFVLLTDVPLGCRE